MTRLSSREELRSHLPGLGPWESILFNMLVLVKEPAPFQDFWVGHDHVFKHEDVALDTF